MVMLVMTLGTYQWPRIAGPFLFRLAARTSCRRLENGIVQRELQATHDIRFLPSCSPFPEDAKKSNLSCDHPSLGFTTTVQVVPAASKNPSGTSSI